MARVQEYSKKSIKKTAPQTAHRFTEGVNSTIVHKKSDEPIRLDDSDIVTASEEKSDEETPLSDDTDIETEETGLDVEELDPFGDKWEQ